MTVRRVMGIETEYGISVPGDPAANPMLLSGQVVHAYASAQGIRAAHASWDYADEAPLRDARGFEMGRGAADASQLTDEDDPSLANVVLTNGSRLYVDHAHPEYSSPEVTSPRAAVIWDRAGEMIMRESVRRLSQVPPGVNLYKNNTDGKGASYGTHENYLMSRETPFSDIVRHLIPFFVARQVMTGSGRVGIGQDSRTAGFQVSQRSDFFEVEVGLETTLKRPIVNTRDEPHAVADLYRRLHVIIGDANHCDVANLLKLGTTSLVLAMIEDRAIDVDLTVNRPVHTLHQVSHDPTCQEIIELRDGTRLTAVQLLWRYHELAERYLKSRYAGELDADTEEVMRWWALVLDTLERDPMAAAREVDWVAKLKVLQGYIDRDGLEWTDHRLQGDRHPVVRRAAGQGHLPPPPCRRPGRGARHRRRGLRRRARAAHRHPGLLPGQVPGEVPRPDRGRVVGLGDLRRARALLAAARPDARAPARDPGERGPPP